MAYRAHYFFFKEMEILEELGLKFLEAREGIDITLEEASEDLQIPIEELENLEKGNIKAFSNVLRVKQIIEKYGKYLGLDYEALVDDFNEYLFDFTSKISLNAIKKANKKEEDQDKIQSPYTMEKKAFNIWYLVISVVVFLILLILFYFVGGS